MIDRRIFIAAAIAAAAKPAIARAQSNVSKITAYAFSFFINYDERRKNRK